MNYNETKTASYIGFAIKMKKLIIGSDNVLKAKNANIIIVSNILTASGLKKIKTFANKNKIDIIELSTEFFEHFWKDKNVKVVAVADKNLAIAIKNLFVSGGGKID